MQSFRSHQVLRVGCRPTTSALRPFTTSAARLEQDHYAVLGVRPNSPKAHVKKMFYQASPRDMRKCVVCGGGAVWGLTEGLDDGGLCV